MIRHDRDTYRVIREFLGTYSGRTSTIAERATSLPAVLAEENHLLATNVMKYTPFLATKEKLEGRVFLNTPGGWARFHAIDLRDSGRAYLSKAETMALRPTLEEQEMLVEMMGRDPKLLRRLIRNGIVAEGAVSDVKHFFPDAAFSYAGIILEVHPMIGSVPEFKRYRKAFRVEDSFFAEREAKRYAGILKREEMRANLARKEAS